MKLVRLPTLQNKYLDTIVHSFISSLHAVTQAYDVCLYFIAGNSPVTWIPRLLGQKTILNVDGLDWKRDKWPGAAKLYIQFAEFLATVFPNMVVTDSKRVQAYYGERFKKSTIFIPYGSEVESLPAGPTLDRFGLVPRDYILFVGRLVPENCAHHLVEAFAGLKTQKKCVIVGGASYADDYVRSLHNTTDSRIVFTGYVFGEGYRELSSNAYLFVETSGVGGTHPALVEAMAFGNCVVVHDTPENLEVIGDAGFSYDGGSGGRDLGRVLQNLLDHPEVVDRNRRKAAERARLEYSWESVVDDYERLFHQVLCAPLPDRLHPRQRVGV
jgi:glycosyltransferase involved in cell wall biosynthesis